MKTISAQVDMMTGFNRIQAQGPAAATLFPQPKIAQWLPTPPVRAHMPQAHSAAHPQKQLHSIWIASESECFLEKAFMAALAGGAAAGICYGLSLVVELVEHWVVFQATISQALQ